MKRANITARITYEVSMVCDVTDDIYNALEHICDNYGREIECCDVEFDPLASKAFDWVSENCKEEDASSWAIEVDDVFEED